MGWMPPAGIGVLCLPSATVALTEGKQMTQVHILAIDLAKRSFQVCGTDRGGACVDAPGLARRFSTVVRERGILSVVCQAS